MSNRPGAGQLMPLLWLGLAGTAHAQAPRPAAPPETRHYAIEVAGLRVGTMTATRQAQPGTTEVVSTLISDVRVTFLFYHLKIYYKVVNRVRSGQLLLSTVEAHTNQGNFSSRAEWLGDHYTIRADQYKYHYQATEKRPITYTITDMFFGEPGSHATAYAEYFGDYFSVARAADGTYRAHRDGREDEYQYTNGQLLTLIKKNPLKNFVIRLLP